MDETDEVDDDAAPLRSVSLQEVEPALLRSRVEALLFVSAKPLKAQALARLLRVETRAVTEALTALSEACADHGIGPVQVGGGWQLRTKPEHGELIRGFLQAKPTRLSRAALETLAIIAYKQPLTRAEVEDIRGVDCGAVIRGLLERRLIRMLGKKDEVGRPILYGTAAGFLEVFGLRSLRELPTLREFVELSEEHQKIVDQHTPRREDVAAEAVRSYLSAFEDDPEAAAWADGVARGDEADLERDETFGGAEREPDDVSHQEMAESPLTNPGEAGNGVDS